ncbi:MAG: tRNA (adenosine(37)-N6)-threonylcarbamoyltransferase complex dimerization subunit type 1 TsaB [Clostridia bacterium]|nr:tRNA (adenosine(37)-N6)-threonylcarbamoyltransferase complex dimerization subunit type 1 TsaB [Clostridia bacterium]
MNYLALDTSGKHLTLIAENNGRVFDFFDPDCGVNHSVRLMPEIENLLIKADMQLSDADFFAAAVGAGSFTGIRIGVSTVKALAFATNKSVLNITSFDTIAYNIDNGKVLAVIDAKHNGFYVCPYENGTAGKAEFITGERLKEFSDYRFLSGEKIAGVETEVVSVKEGFYRAIARKQSEITADVNALKPLYVRKSQAEEGR